MQQKIENQAGAGKQAQAAADILENIEEKLIGQNSIVQLKEGIELRAQNGQNVVVRVPGDDPFELCLFLLSFIQELAEHGDSVDILAAADRVNTIQQGQIYRVERQRDQIDRSTDLLSQRGQRLPVAQNQKHCAKLVAAGACYEGDAWELVKHPGLIEKALPVICVLTVAATGSEMDHIAVISNDETQEKIGTRNPLLRPKASILDPSYTFSVSPYQTAAGVADIMSHAMESYFSREPADLQNYFAEAILRVCVENGKRLLDEPDNYEARANVMWAASWAINDTLKMGHMVQWSVHPIEHQLSAVYDVTHGEGLAILTPHWMRRVLDEESVGQFEELAVHIWKVKPSGDRFRTAQEGIACLERFFESLGLKSRLSQLGIDESHFEEMAAKAAAQVKGAYRELTKEDIIQIYRDSL